MPPWCFPGGLDGKQPACYSLIYVNEMIYLPGNLPFFKIHVNHFMVQDDSPAANVISMHVVGDRPGAIL